MHERRLQRYAVELGKPGYEFPSYGGMEGTPSLFVHRKDAIAHRDEIAKQGCRKGRVVKVLCLYQWAEKKPRKSKSKAKIK